MRLIEINKINSQLIRQLVKIWDKSVRETHLFLSDAEIREIEKYIPQALNSVAHLVIVINDENNPIAFMGIEEGKLEMLFILPGCRGQGLGRLLLEYGIDKYSINNLGVNEQESTGKRFL